MGGKEGGVWLAVILHHHSVLGLAFGLEPIMVPLRWWLLKHLAQFLAHVCWQLLTITTPFDRKIVVERVVDVERVTEIYFIGMNPLDMEHVACEGGLPSLLLPYC